MVLQVAQEQFSFLNTAAESGQVSLSAVVSFVSATATLLQQMLMSKNPIIPWTGLQAYDPTYVEVDARQLPDLSASACEDAFQRWQIVGYKRPILLSCSHGQVKIDKGKVRLEVPRK